MRDLRISVGDVLGWLAQGMSTEAILADYPELTGDDIRACLAYAAAREFREVVPQTAFGTEFEAQMAMARPIVEKCRDVLRELAR